MSDELEKMALGSIKPVKTITEDPLDSRWDYSNILPKESQDAGYSLHVSVLPQHSPKLGYATIESHLYHKGNPVGYLQSRVKPGNVVAIDASEINAAHRGKGLGVSLYEGALSHAFNHLGATTLEGQAHSSMASRTHASLARRHGLKYQAKPNINIPGQLDTYGSKEEWKDAPNGPFDYKRGPYSTALKSEEIQEWLNKSENPITAQYGINDKISRAIEAAQFLSPKRPTEQEIRAAIKLHGYDLERAILHAHGVEINEENIKHLKSAMKMLPLDKAEFVPPKKAYALTTDGTEAAEGIQRAIDEYQIEPLQLKGKHSKGSLKASDPDGYTYILKPANAGGVSPAAGVKEEKADQARREAAFWQIAQLLHIEKWFPRADVVILDGVEYAAIHMLPYDWKNYGDFQEEHPMWARQILEQYKSPGIVHMWAFLDVVCGQSDRHSNNGMTDKKYLMLIDAGSSFAGDDFSPATDDNSFVPFYLRAYCDKSWADLSPKEQLASMPRVGEKEAKMLKKWVSEVDSGMITQILQEYGINPEPTLKRLQKLHQTQDVPMDLAINAAWVVT